MQRDNLKASDKRREFKLSTVISMSGLAPNTDRKFDGNCLFSTQNARTLSKKKCRKELRGIGCI